MWNFVKWCARIAEPKWIVDCFHFVVFDVTIRCNMNECILSGFMEVVRLFKDIKLYSLLCEHYLYSKEELKLRLLLWNWKRVRKLNYINNYSLSTKFRFKCPSLLYSNTNFVFYLKCKFFWWINFKDLFTEKRERFSAKIRIGCRSSFNLLLYIW